LQECDDAESDENCVPAPNGRMFSMISCPGGCVVEWNIPNFGPWKMPWG